MHDNAPRNLKPLDWQARFVWFLSASSESKTFQDVPILDAEDISDDTCATGSCSLASVTLQAYNNQAILELCLKASPAICVQNDVLKYNTYIVYMDPTSAQITTDFDPYNLIDVYITDLIFYFQWAAHKLIAQTHHQTLALVQNCRSTAI